ncbi:MULTISPECIES: hypothetical protein [unclassified Mesorhizobium]|uniref:hypothetical protein n=1 Tax=unclassified Mesorhizobium TaxID=325217 RepID=UPI003338F2F9
MTHESCLRFDGTSLQPCEPPEWYANVLRDADATGGDWAPILARNGIHLEQQFGKDLDTVHVYNAGRHGYLIEYWDMNQCLANILIADVHSYLEFRAKHLHAWAWLIAETERIADADYQKLTEQRRKRA